MLLSVDEAAELLAIDADHCRRLCTEGLQRDGERIRLAHVHQGRELRIDPTDLHQFALSLAEAGAPASPASTRRRGRSLVCTRHG